MRVEIFYDLFLMVTQPAFTLFPKVCGITRMPCHTVEPVCTHVLLPLSMCLGACECALVSVMSKLFEMSLHHVSSGILSEMHITSSNATFLLMRPVGIPF